LLLAGPHWLAAGAGAGAIASLFFLMLLGLRLRRLESFSSPLEPGGSLVRLILLGAMLSALFGAVTSLLLTLAPQAALRGILFWFMGDLGGAQVPPLFWLLGCVLVVAALRLTRDLNLLCRGEEYAWSLGVAVGPRRWQVLLLASLATACAVSVGGTIGFVGLVVPHALRSVIGNDQRILLPAAMLCGGGFLLLCDTLARTVMAPMQLPVGVVTALIGAPLFIVLLLRGEVERGHHAESA
jgi:iron complex transport system permease protein